MLSLSPPYLPVASRLNICLLLTSGQAYVPFTTCDLLPYAVCASSSRFTHMPACMRLHGCWPLPLGMKPSHHKAGHNYNSLALSWQSCHVRSSMSRAPL